MFPGGASGIKNTPVMQELQEVQVWSLGQEDTLEKEMATHFSILAWRIPWTEEPGRLQVTNSQTWPKRLSILVSDIVKICFTFPSITSICKSCSFQVLYLCNHYMLEQYYFCDTFMLCLCTLFIFYLPFCLCILKILTTGSSLVVQWVRIWHF